MRQFPSVWKVLGWMGILVFCVSCGVNPVTGKRELSFISEASEVNIGEKNYFVTQQAQGGKYVVDPSVTNYVSLIGLKLASVSDRPHLPYEFVVLNNSVPNAWALPGGKIAVNRGLLLELESEAELAAVLGHEIVHAAARHTAQRMQQGMVLQVGMAGLGVATQDHQYGQIIGSASNVMGVLFMQKYSRHHELEADKFGMQYLARLGYDPMAAVHLQETFLRLSKSEKKSDWLSGLLASHPPSQERIDANRKSARGLRNGEAFQGKEEYQAVIASLKETKDAYDLYDKGVASLAKGQLLEAMTLSEQALDIEPREALFYSLKGQSLTQGGRYAEAIVPFNKAVELNPNYYEFYLQRGVLKRQMQDLQGAKWDLEKSLTMLPTALAHYEMGELNMRLGHVEQAIQHYRAASQSKSAEGEKARQGIASIDLPNNPSKYLRIWASTDRFGHLIVTVENQSSIDVENLVMEIAFAEGPVHIGPRILYFNEVIKSGNRTNRSVHIGYNYRENDVLNTIRMRIQKVGVVR